MNIEVKFYGPKSQAGPSSRGDLWQNHRVDWGREGVGRSTSISIRDADECICYLN